MEKKIAADIAFAVRPGEHACCRCADAEDRDRLVASLVWSGLRRGHRVVYVCDGDPAPVTARLAAADDLVEPALASGQVEVRRATDVFLPDGEFDPDRMGALLAAEHDRALEDGYSGLSIAGEMTWALNGAPGSKKLADYEAAIVDMVENDGDMVFLCVYDHARFGAGELAEIAEGHDVDVSSELAVIGRAGYLAAARVQPGSVLRLAGDLDFGSADALVTVLEAHYHGLLRLDLADLQYVDVTGMRALRGMKGQRLTILAFSEPVRRLLGLLAWDTDPDVEIVEPAPA